MLGDDSCPRLSPHRGFRVRACCYSFPSSGWRARAQALILRRREAAAPLPAEAPATERLRPRERRVSEQPPPVLEPPEPPFTLRPLCATRRALPNYVTAHNKPAVTLPTRMPLGQVKGASWSSGNGEPRGSHLRPSHRIAESLRETALGQPWLLRTAPLAAKLGTLHLSAIPLHKPFFGVWILLPLQAHRWNFELQFQTFICITCPSLEKRAAICSVPTVCQALYLYILLNSHMTLGGMGTIVPFSPRGACNLSRIQSWKGQSMQKN
ncbi:uncharacterized protein LOC118154473 isoform X2 [Callithrix jacchus]|uniref:uncharacterized protein LOC118154473 isoform X3 n=1 Tax=Callithrix jacchus TaxID=9483 RepID=UPI00159D5E6D|nr:uncharacterized protein LOC118154473 isoform X3 [Callithrix jacchus]